ncbi:hypothetical protein [Streptomyces scopuliridis]|uniref:hypothetical protein n=1 Tax=Streptomyces scopuliridis TaxID=452529 RepID=UPI00343A7951
MKRVIKFTGILEYDPETTNKDPEWCLDTALERGDKHADYCLFHTGELEIVDVHGKKPGE